jgi:hypothetical protein
MYLSNRSTVQTGNFADEKGKISRENTRRQGES